MKKLINNPENYVDEVLQGMCLTYPENYAIDGETSRVLRRTQAAENKVGVVSGGGFGTLMATALMAAARTASTETLAEFKGKQCKIGRARIFGERTVGMDDPGMMAIDRMLECL